MFIFYNCRPTYHPVDRLPSFHSFVEKRNYCGPLYDDHNVLGGGAGGSHNFRNCDNNHGIHL